MVFKSSCGWAAPVLSERSEFSGASIFYFVFVATDKNEGTECEEPQLSFSDKRIQSGKKTNAHAK